MTLRRPFQFVARLRGRSWHRRSAFDVRVFPDTGMAFAGTAEALGAGLTEYPLGTPVFGPTEMKGRAHVTAVCSKGGRLLPVTATLAAALRRTHLDSADQLPYQALKRAHCASV